MTDQPNVPDWRTLPRYERVHDTITEGGAIGVLLSNRDARAWVSLDDYRRLIASFGTIRWLWEKRLESVVLRDRPRHIVSVARLILREEAPGFVKYHDDDPLNLRSVNLSVGATMRPRRDGLTKVRAEKAAQRKREVEERKASRAEEARKAAEEAAARRKARPKKRVPSGPAVRPVAPPPPAIDQPVAASTTLSVPRKTMIVVRGVRRGGLN